MSPRHGEVYRHLPVPNTLGLGSQNQKTAHPRPPPPQVSWPVILGHSPQLFAQHLKKLRPEGRGNGGDHTQQVWAGRQDGSVQQSFPGSFQAGLGDPLPPPPKPLLLPRVELIRTSASQPTPRHLLILFMCPVCKCQPPWGSASPWVLVHPPSLPPTYLPPPAGPDGRPALSLPGFRPNVFAWAPLAPVGEI